MPKGVICAGAVDGSNQAGAMVTCQAMTALPFGSGPDALQTGAAAATEPTISAPETAANRRPNGFISSSQTSLRASLIGAARRLSHALCAGTSCVDRGTPIALGQAHCTFPVYGEPSGGNRARQSGLHQNDPDRGGGAAQPRHGYPPEPRPVLDARDARPRGSGGRPPPGPRRGEHRFGPLTRA